ncbi:hypothetical protein Tco_0324839 [Tanacetum coccineum]
MKTPMSSDTKLTKDEECELIDSTKYRGMIGSLLYLMASKLDIMFSVCVCARFQEAPKTSHLEAFKRIFRYIKGTTHLGLWYPKGTGIETVVYAESDHACTTEFAAALPSPSPPPENVESLKDNIRGACVFTDKWSLDELAYGVPRDGPYQTNPPSPDDIILKDRGTRRGCHSTSSSFAFYQPSSSHLNDDDDDDDENDEETSRASTPSPTGFVNSLTNEVPRVF